MAVFAALAVSGLLVAAFATYYATIPPPDRATHFNCDAECGWADFTYFSLLTFLGNGDFQAKGPMMRLVVGAEMVTGFVVIVLLFAMVVSLASSFTIEAVTSVRDTQARLERLLTSLGATPPSRAAPDAEGH